MPESRKDLQNMGAYKAHVRVAVSSSPSTDTDMELAAAETSRAIVPDPTSIGFELQLDPPLDAPRSVLERLNLVVPSPDAATNTTNANESRTLSTDGVTLKVKIRQDLANEPVYPIQNIPLLSLDGVSAVLEVRNLILTCRTFRLTHDIRY